MAKEVVGGCPTVVVGGCATVVKGAGADDGGAGVVVEVTSPAVVGADDCGVSVAQPEKAIAKVMTGTAHGRTPASDARVDTTGVICRLRRPGDVDDHPGRVGELEHPEADLAGETKSERHVPLEVTDEGDLLQGREPGVDPSTLGERG